MTDFAKREEIDEKADDLREAAGLCNDECGEWWAALAALVPGYRDGASDVFAAAIESEIVIEHGRLKDEFRIDEREITVKQTQRRLVHYSEE